MIIDIFVNGKKKKWKQMKRHEKVASVLAGTVAFGSGILFGSMYCSYREKYPEDPVIFTVPAFAATLAGAGLTGGILGAATEEFVNTIHDDWMRAKLGSLGTIKEPEKEEEDDD